MKRFPFIALALVISTQAYTQNWNSSPYNFNNFNLNNTPYNFKNSPYNFNNSQYNLNATNGIYDADGNRQGYIVRRPDGGANLFDDEGNCTGYVPGRNLPDLDDLDEE